MISPDNIGIFYCLWKQYLRHLENTFKATEISMSWMTDTDVILKRQLSMIYYKLEKHHKPCRIPHFLHLLLFKIKHWKYSSLCVSIVVAWVLLRQNNFGKLINVLQSETKHIARYKSCGCGVVWPPWRAPCNWITAIRYKGVGTSSDVS